MQTARSARCHELRWHTSRKTVLEKTTMKIKLSHTELLTERGENQSLIMTSERNLCLEDASFLLSSLPHYCIRGVVSAT